jgi:putative transposase
MALSAGIILLFTRLNVLLVVELSPDGYTCSASRPPTGDWAARQARNLLMDLADRIDAVKFLLRDRDTESTSTFDAVFAGEGIRIILTPPQAPRANVIAERWVGSVRRGLLDRRLILNRRQLHPAVTEYVDHHNVHRPHRPGPSRTLENTPQPAGDNNVRVLRRDRLGGVIREYAAA